VHPGRKKKKKTWTLTSSKALETYRPPQCTEAASNMPLIQLTLQWEKEKEKEKDCRTVCPFLTFRLV